MTPVRRAARACGGRTWTVTPSGTYVGSAVRTRVGVCVIRCRCTARWYTYSVSYTGAGCAVYDGSGVTDQYGFPGAVTRVARSVH